MLRFLSRPIYGALVVFLVSFVVYLLTLASGVGFIDSGELATVCATLGIAHPTGYPLFTLVGFLFSQLPIASMVIVRLNIMSALFSALGAGAVVFLGHEIHRHWLAIRRQVKEKAKKKGDMGLKYGMMFVSSLVTAYGMSWLVHMAGASNWMTGALLGAMAWLFFTVTVQFAGWLFSGKKLGALVVDTGYYLVSFVVFGALLSVWK